MRGKVSEAAESTVAAGTRPSAVAAPGLVPAALAAPRTTAAVPCSATTLATDVSGAVTGETLKLAATSTDTTVTDSAFTSNSAPGGGALDNFDPSSAALTVTGSRFASNSAQTQGEAIYNGSGSTSAVTLASTALSRNHPDNCAPAGSVSGCTARRELGDGPPDFRAAGAEPPRRPHPPLRPAAPG